MFLQIPTVRGASATRARGKIKHYNIHVETKNSNADRVAKIWPYCHVVVENNSTSVDFIVKPEEVNAFFVKLSKLHPEQKEKEMALILQLNGTLTDKTKNKVEKCVRSSDRVIWGDNKVAIVLEDCKKETIKAVEKRIEMILSEDRLSSKPQTDQLPLSGVQGRC